MSRQLWRPTTESDGIPFEVLCGVVVKLNYKGMVTGEASVKLPENSAILYYNINAFGTKLKDSLALLSV